MENQAESLHEIVRLPVNQQSTSQLVPSRGSKEKTGYNVSSPPLEETYAISTPSNYRERNFELRGASVHEVSSSSAQLPRSDQESISNPLALLADASDAARLLECSSLPTHTSHALAEDLSPTQRPGDRVTGSLGSRLLQRPGYISLGLQLNRRCLEDGLDALMLPVQRERQYPKYFKVPTYNHPCDVGPDLDPVDLGLVTMEEASYLFPVYFTQLHPINGILDPVLHTPQFVRSRSSLLFTWILALTAQFDHGSASIAKRLRLHGEKLSNYVHTSGFKSVEIVQGYYISLLSATPAKTLAEERSWLYTMYAIGVAMELGLDQDARPKVSLISMPTSPNQNMRSSVTASGSEKLKGHELLEGSAEASAYNQRLNRNRERTWLRILLWERANSAAYGRTNSFPETALTRGIESWWLHPLADSADRHTCAFIALRKKLASLHVKLRDQAQLATSNSQRIKELVDTSLQPWCNVWLPYSVNLPSSHSEKMSEIFLRYVYLHGRLWTLSIALQDTMCGGLNMVAIREDCFEAAVKICEVAVQDLQAFGEPLYGMLAPTWAMICYAAVLTLKLFPTIYGARPECQVELFALLGQVALQLERAGTTPSHRFGIAALLGQHLMMILRAKSWNLQGQIQPSMPYGQRSHDAPGITSQEEGADQARPCESYMSEYDPFLAATDITFDDDPTEEIFADMFREIFGPGFGGVL
ncbi:hypothetical protein PENARI_c002G02491 [Penicillium arizonense]|uniref:Transcription factor domain-containing protein n=1 Tax=Penicillium arizonense TaxID=1835702 RepID=A0A1F5LUG3_PENAI|nr:hypothetical protein PENARI_c002G02491 [Penicillium arizonense]OGE56812.1 hypothetical protein PENARI_c002G02491 [Penicillium arizonense]